MDSLAVKVAGIPGRSELIDLRDAGGVIREAGTVGEIGDEITDQVRKNLPGQATGDGGCAKQQSEREGHPGQDPAEHRALAAYHDRVSHACKGRLTAWSGALKYPGHKFPLPKRDCGLPWLK